jgi:hypothetical protein
MSREMIVPRLIAPVLSALLPWVTCPRSSIVTGNATFSFAASEDLQWVDTSDPSQLTSMAEETAKPVKLETASPLI